MKGCLTTYSFRNDFTGLLIAAFTDFNPTVKTAIETDSAAAMMRIVAPIFTRRHNF